MRILVLNGPNLNLLGTRETEIYGKQSYADLVCLLTAYGESLGIQVECFQSNHEGDLVDAIQAASRTADGIVINPGAYTHTSIAILDALKAVGLPAVEVHISDPTQREAFRRISYTGMACVKTFSGMGFDGYLRAVDCLRGVCGAR